MQEELFNSWLQNQSYSNKRVISDNKSRCKRIERELAVNLDEEFTKDSLKEVLKNLKYTAEDARNGVPVPLGLTVARPVQSLATLRTAVKNYRSFRQAGTIEGATNHHNPVFDDLKQAFGDWLEDDYTAGTASSYKTYLNQLKISYEQSCGEGSFNHIILSFQNRNIVEIERQIFLCQNFILRNKSTDLVHSTDWSNRFNVFNQFIDYLEDVYEIEARFEQERPIRQVSPTPTRRTESEPHQNLTTLSFSLTQNELSHIFYNRLTTQSRSYLTNGEEGIGLIFPVRLIRSIFQLGHDNRFKNLIKNDISRISFLDASERRCLFRDVREVFFDGNGNVKVIENSGHEFELYTKAFQNVGNQVYHKQMQAYSADMLSIDHVTPMENTMRSHRNELHALKKITDCFNQFNSDNRLNPKADRNWKDSLLAEYPELYTENFRNQLWADLNLIRVDYEIMDKKENSRRSNRA